MDVSQLTDEELLDGNGILPKILVCERTKDINKLIKNCKRIAKNRLTEEEKNIFNRYVKTILENKLGENNVKEILEILNNKEEENEMIEEVISKAFDDAERKGMKRGLRKGMKQGIQQGMQQGMQQGVQQGFQKARESMIINMIKNNLSNELIKIISGASDEELEKIKRGITDI